MRFVTGYNNRGGGKVKYERKIRRSDCEMQLWDCVLCEQIMVK